MSQAPAERMEQVQGQKMKRLILAAPSLAQMAMQWGKGAKMEESTCANGWLAVD